MESKKIRVFALFVMMGLFCQLGAQNLLQLEWQFKSGDKAIWADPEYDDSDWKKIQAGNDWENQGYENYDGFAWYRQSVFIPGSLKESASENGGLMLYLGRIDDSDITYWNGEEIGRTGDMPPNYQTGYGYKRAYNIPVESIKWEEENTIAVRVYDGGGGGGIVDEPVALSLRGMEELFVVRPVMEQADHIFPNEGPVIFTLEMENKMNQHLTGNLELKALSDFGDEVLEISRGVKIKSGRKSEINVDMGSLDPGFYNISATISSETGNKRINFAIGVRPEEIESPLDRPEDFEDYWKRARRELDAVEPQFKLIRQDELCTDTRDFYILEMRSLGNILVRAWYMRPKKDGVYPAILHVQGYSTFLVPDWMYPGDDMVALGLNIRGHGFSQDHVSPGFPGYILHNVEDRETYVYRGAYMDCIRAMDFLYSREEVDQSRIAVEGGSQGGALSFATAALDPERVDVCVPHVPFLSDFRDYFKVAGWPAGEFFSWFKEHPDIPQDSIYKNLSYIDIKNLAPWIKAPVLMSIGLVDQTCPPHINFAAYNQLEVPKKYLVYPNAGHNLPGEHNKVKYDFIRKQFGMD
jgi:cephalosporin-C deacetylase-like acetyl esterase